MNMVSAKAVLIAVLRTGYAGALPLFPDLQGPEWQPPATGAIGMVEWAAGNRLRDAGGETELLTTEIGATTFRVFLPTGQGSGPVGREAEAVEALFFERFCEAPAGDTGSLRVIRTRIEDRGLVRGLAAHDVIVTFENETIRSVAGA